MHTTRFFETFVLAGHDRARCTAQLVDEFRVNTRGWTQHYVATGRVRPQQA